MTNPESARGHESALRRGCRRAERWLEGGPRDPRDPGRILAWFDEVLRWGGSPRERLARFAALFRRVQLGRVSDRTAARLYALCPRVLLEAGWHEDCRSFAGWVLGLTGRDFEEPARLVRRSAAWARAGRRWEGGAAAYWLASTFLQQAYLLLQSLQDGAEYEAWASLALALFGWTDDAFDGDADPIAELAGDELRGGLRGVPELLQAAGEALGFRGRVIEAARVMLLYAGFDDLDFDSEDDGPLVGYARGVVGHLGPAGAESVAALLGDALGTLGRFGDSVRVAIAFDRALGESERFPG